MGGRKREEGRQPRRGRGEGGGDRRGESFEHDLELEVEL